MVKRLSPDKLNPEEVKRCPMTPESRNKKVNLKDVDDFYIELSVIYSGTVSEANDALTGVHILGTKKTRRLRAAKRGQEVLLRDSRVL